MNTRIPLALIFLIAACGISLLIAIQSDATGSRIVHSLPGSPESRQESETTDPDHWIEFDNRVREDFVKGVSGDKAALGRTIDACDKAIEADEDHALAMCLRGVCLVFQSGEHFENNNFQEGMKLWSAGLQGLEKAVAKNPDSPRVRLYRGEVLLQVWIHDPQNGAALAKTAATDIDYVYSRAAEFWNTIELARQKRIIAALPKAFSKFGDDDNAEKYREIAKRLGTGVSDAGSDTTNADGEERLDLLVRDDLFAGMAGDRERHRKAMEICEERLTRNPHDAGALSFHGWGLLIESGWKAEDGDDEPAARLQQQAMQEMNLAVSLEPDQVGPLLVRGSVLMGLTTNPELPSTEKDMYLALATYDFERVHQLQLEQGYFRFLSEHARGELLFGLADAWHRRGNLQKARDYYTLVMKEIPETDYADDSSIMLSGKMDPARLKTRQCIGCHK